MAEKSRDPVIVAIEAVYAALKDMDADSRKKVLSSAFTLLGVEGPQLAKPSVAQGANFQSSHVSVASGNARPMSLVELIQDKRPGTNAQCIAVFAYYRERYEGVSRFSRGDLKPYFAKAKLTPSANYDRDFGGAIKNAWIHEDGAESYLTTKGIEAVENGFEGAARNPTRKKRSSKKKRR
jgi:hypothetical protein